MESRKHLDMDSIGETHTHKIIKMMVKGSPKMIATEQALENSWSVINLLKHSDLKSHVHLFFLMDIK